MTSAISNPPYNLKWSFDGFVGLDERFNVAGLPPENNANYAFILTALNLSDRSVVLLPNAVLTTDNQQEKTIREYLIDKNLIEAVILCPDNMFENTPIPTCILVFQRDKKTSTVEMIDLRKSYKEEIREQRGQFGGKAHTKRIYKKVVKIIDDETIRKVVECINGRETEKGFCSVVSLENIKAKGYDLRPSLYIENEELEIKHRNLSDIVCDLNRIIEQKNTLKLVINENLAMQFGIDKNIFGKKIDFTDVNELLENQKSESIKKADYITFTKNKNQLEFKNNNPNTLSSILIMILNDWKKHLFYLNNEENRYLAELRDALLPDLMSGKISVENGKDTKDEKPE